MSRAKRTFSLELKKKAIEDFISGKKSASALAAELGVTVSHIYKWRVQLSEKKKGAQIEELESQGMRTRDAKKFLQQQAIIEEYQKKVAEQSIIIDLLKKLQEPEISQHGSELTGLLETLQRLDRSRKPAK